MTLARRSFLTGLASLVAAPAIVRVASIMPVRAMPPELYGIGPMTYSKMLIEFRNQAMREYLRKNLFTPYLGDSLVGHGPLPTPWAAQA